MPLHNSGVTQVTSANADIAVASSTTAPALTLNSGTGVNQIVKLDGSGRLPSIDGSQLTGISGNADVSYLNGQQLEQSIAILELQAENSLAPSDYETMFLDIFSDDDGYDDTIDTGATTATFQTDKYINSSAPPSGNLVEWWNFNDNTGAGELSALNWTKTGTIGAVSGLVGNSCQVNNANVTANYFSRSRFLDTAQYGSGSWAFWCKQTDIDAKKIGGRGVQSSTTDWLIYVNVDGSFTVYIADSMQVTATGLVSANTWFHLALTWDASNTYFYVNGTLRLTWTGHRLMNTNSTDYIYRSYHSDDQTQTIEFDEMCFYSRTLSGGEIAALYNGGTGTSSSGAAADKLVITETITLPDDIVAYQLFCRKETAGSGSFKYQVSVDDGDNYTADKDPDTKYTFATSGTDLKLKFKLNGSGGGNTCHLYNYALMVWY